ncbi:laminin subunit gamma-2 [Protopterus annectens]|uniref:laminin subunit gamma-2 n=1 Tax=Protopterus annectens TaxID=7888 RepID=UPI001CFC3222|nr:laminin subunit gamma-2 [Protopterus annectens]
MLMRCAVLALCCLLSLHLPHISGTYREEGCSCNGRSEQCSFDEALYRQTGNGYYCLNCKDNTDGQWCERCKAGFYHLRQEDTCLPCSCSITGSVNTQCDKNGQCTCKPGTTGEKCDRCLPGYHLQTNAECTRNSNSADNSGLTRCDCDVAGTAGRCDPSTGHCTCKEFVAGDRCDKCKPDYYNLEAGNPSGCTKCFCFGHSANCVSADGYSIHTIHTSFDKDSEGWKAVKLDGTPVNPKWSSQFKDIYVNTRTVSPVYFVAPANFIRNQHLSYGQNLTFSLRIDRGRRQPSPEDIVLEGAGMKVSTSLVPLRTVVPCGISQNYVLRLDEHPSSKWRPQLSNFEFRRLLHNLTSIKIRATYGNHSTGYLHNVTLVSARPVSGAPASWVEICTCPPAYQGQFCEKCAVGYKRESPHLGSFSTCVPCDCKGGPCDQETGDCYSGDQTPEEECADCPLGSYNDINDPRNCRPCPCPTNYGCSVMPETEEVVCNKCPGATTGIRCHLCATGYYGDPLGESGQVRPCKPCQCNKNVKPKEPGHCDHLTGECLKCMYNTEGSHCERCKEGYYGNALATNTMEKCQACKCNPVGSLFKQCGRDGQCACKSGFQGLFCEQPLCPDCYRQVTRKVEQHLQRLNDLENVLARIETGEFTSLPDSELQGRIREADLIISNTLKDARAAKTIDQSLQNHITNIKNDQSAQTDRLKQIKTTADQADSLAGQYNDRLQYTRGQIQETRAKLRQARMELDKVVVPVFDLPTDTNALMVMAQQAVNLANKHKQTADEIDTLAKSAKSSSGEAFQLLQSSLLGQSELTSAIQDLGRRYDRSKTDASKLGLGANRANSEADKASQEARRILTDIANLPKVNIKPTETQVGTLKFEADGLGKKVDGVLAQLSEVQANTQNVKDNIQNLFKKEKQDGQVAGQLQARVENAKTRAEDALKLGTSTMNDVDGILKAFQDFNQKVYESKADAENAMAKIPIIERTIRGANDQIDQAEMALGNAIKDAKTARETSENAKSIAANADLEATRLSDDLKNSLEGALRLKADIARLEPVMAAAEMELLKKESEARRDKAKVQEVSDDATRATAYAKATGDDVQDTMTLINRLLNQLDNPGSMDDEQLTSLEESVKRTRTQINSHIRQQMTQLSDIWQRQNERIFNLDQSIDNILVDIKNLEQIRDSLPMGCYNTQAIESP